LELVYLWVEDYKNIKKQGFNFSPRFHCEYDEGKNELTIKENDDYIPDFFGKNINVTAIVGKNGSGKSSVFEFILDRLANRYSDYPKNFIFLYLDKNKFYKYDNFFYNLNSKMKVEKYPNRENLLNYCTNLITLYLNNQRERIEPRDSEKLFIENHNFNQNYINKILIKNYMGINNQLIKNTNSFFRPMEVQFNIKIMDSFFSILDEDKKFYSDGVWEKVEKLKEKLKDSTFYERLMIVIDIFEIKYKEHTTVPKFDFNIERVSNGSFYKYKIEKSFIDNIPKIIKNNKLKESNFKLNIHDITPNIFDFIEQLPYIFDIIVLDNNKSFNNLSYGERQLLAQLNFILYYLNKNSYEYHHLYYADGGEIDVDEYENIAVNEIIVLLDEFELGLHPDWQKNFISYIIKFFKNIDKKINIILTSHSPFLLSDIPKQNIIFLDKDENGNCKVVDGLKEKKQTFGANIHTLLSDSFFMEDGLMGEFAKGKIDDVINYLHGKESKIKSNDEAQKLIHIIGEPIVKNQLQRMLDSKRLKKVDEIDAIKKSMLEMKKRLDDLEK